MDFVNFARSVEQGIFDTMMAVLFFPYTLARTVLQPARTLEYVQHESAQPSEIAFGSGMRPALLLFAAISAGSLMAPLTPQDTAALQHFQLARLLTESWLSLIMWRSMVYGFFALVGALLFDLLTPGEVTRQTLREPFNQQCYLCAPFALPIIPLMVLASRGLTHACLGLLIASTLWFIAAQYAFFRQRLRHRPVACWAMALTVPGAGTAWIFLTGRVIFLI